MNAGTRRRLRWAVALPLTGLIAFGVLGAVQERLDEHRDARRQDALLYLPNEKLLNHFTVGMSTVVADLLWLKCVQYTAAEFHDQDAKFEWLGHIVDTCTRLDPHFTGAYAYGGTLLAGIGAPEVALPLLKRGIRNRPDRWELPWEVAKIYVLNLRDEPGAKAAASHYLAMTADLADPEHAEFLMKWAYTIQVESDLGDVGRAIWRNILETSGNDMMRDLARRKLIHLDLVDARDALQQTADAYAGRTGQPPESMAALVEAGYLTREPEDPLGGTFFLHDGTVMSTTLLDEEAAEIVRMLGRGIAHYRETRGRAPATLDELVTSGILKGIPDHPYPGRSWRYDPNAGTID
jgi:hypothetical protein